MLGRLREEGGVLSDTLGEQFPWVNYASYVRKLLADAELSNDRLIALGIVSFEVVQ